MKTLFVRTIASLKSLGQQSPWRTTPLLQPATVQPDARARLNPQKQAEFSHASRCMWKLDSEA